MSSVEANKAAYDISLDDTAEPGFEQRCANIIDAAFAKREKALLAEIASLKVRLEDEHRMVMQDPRNWED